MTRYLFIDHGGVLDGEYIEGEPGANDLLLEKTEWGYNQVLKDGVKIVNYLNALINRMGYQLVFHSKNKEEDQNRLHKLLQEAAAKKGLHFPYVIGMGVHDEKYKTHSPSAPKIEDNTNFHYKIPMAGYYDANPAEDDGKSTLRLALSKLLKIETKDKVLIFDDGPSVVIKARAEGHQAYRIGSGEDALSRTYAKAMLRVGFISPVF